jgi:type VI secretion system secreted protein Hcp
LTSYFLKLDGIPGESTDAKHKDEIELVTFAWGATDALAPSGGGVAGRAKFEDFHFTMLVNKASPQLFLATASGKHIKEGNLAVRKAGKTQVEYLKIKFTDVIVTSFQEVGGTEEPQEAISFAYGTIAIEYTPQSSKGAAGGVIKVGWDLSRNVKI